MIDKYKYTETELKKLVSTMTVLVDTREQKNDHITSYFDAKGVLYQSRKLDYGDYSFMIPANEELNIPRDLYFDKQVVVERKGSPEELSGNLTKGRDRIEKEFTLAPETKVLLLENCSYQDIVLGNYNTKYNNKSYWTSLHKFWHKYNMPIMFMPDNKYSGMFIRGYLECYLKNYIR